MTSLTYTFTVDSRDPSIMRPTGRPRNRSVHICCSYTPTRLIRLLKDLAPPPILLSLLLLDTFCQDHIGAAGLVVDYFAADEPMVISSRYPRFTIIKKNRRDPTTAFGNNRGVPLPEWYQEDVFAVGGLRFDMDRVDVHETGDYLLYLNKERVKNANEGIMMRYKLCTRYDFEG